MAMLADLVDVVIGVDTHKHTHTIAIVTAATGAVVNQATVAATTAGYQQLLALATQQPGQRIWAIESTGGYGAGLTWFLHAHHEQVVELDRPKRAARRHGAKSDSLDATRAAREALGRDQLAQPRAAGHRAALQVRLTARRSAVQATGDAQRQLHALVTAAPETLRGRLRNMATPPAGHCLPAAAPPHRLGTQTTATAASLRALARRIQLLDAETAQHTRAITTLVRAWRPELLTRTGVGPIVAAAVLCAWSHHGRCRSEAAFAMLGGAAPIPASSGQTMRYRRNRSGDRQLNQALHVVVMTRLRTDQRPALTPSGVAPRARPTARSNAAWSATSPASSTGNSRSLQPLTQHRSVRVQGNDRSRSPCTA
jgi:transposase